jgi:DNA repair exonuclease SbcCD ATPase subunit
LESRLSCPYCGTPIKGNENFCRYCGRLIGGRAAAIPAGREEPSVQLEIPKDVFEQIDIRVQLGSADSKLKACKEEVNEMDSLLKNADIPLSEYRGRIAKLKDEIKEAKEQKANLEEKMKPFPFEEHKKQYEDLKEKADKLEKLHSAKQVSDEAYRSLSREYQLKRRDLENMISADASNIKNWINLMNIEKSSAKKKLDIMSAKQAVGDMSDQSYAEEKKNLENRLISAEFGIDLLKKFVS